MRLPQPASATPPLPAELPSPLVYPLADNQRLIAMIAEILQQPTDTVRRWLYEEELCLGAFQRRDVKAWGLAPNVWSDQLAEFYRQTHMGIVGNPVWNRRQAKLDLRQWIGRFLVRDWSGPADVLTVGDGSGFDSLYLALCGHRVTYSEESQSALAFARRLFAEAGAAIAIEERPQALPAEAFDVVVCLDVLEHVPEPPQFVARLARHLRPGGRLIVHAPFFFADEWNPTHLKANQKYSGDLRSLYLANGLAPLDGRLFWDPLVLQKRAVDARPAPLAPRVRLRLVLGGLLLRIGRWWNWPHTRIAVRAMQQGETRWRAGLTGTESG